MDWIQHEAAPYRDVMTYNTTSVGGPNPACFRFDMLNTTKCSPWNHHFSILHDRLQENHVDTDLLDKVREELLELIKKKFECGRAKWKIGQLRVLLDGTKETAN